MSRKRENLIWPKDQSAELMVLVTQSKILTVKDRPEDINMGKVIEKLMKKNNRFE